MKKSRRASVPSSTLKLELGIRVLDQSWPFVCADRHRVLLALAAAQVTHHLG